MNEYYKFRPEDAERFAMTRGAKTKRRGHELQLLRCPYCGSDDKWTFSINLETGMFKCLRASCGAHGNMITLAKDFNFSLGDADEYYGPRRKYRTLKRDGGKPEPTESAVAYLESRGISRKIAERYHITTRKDNEKILVFPFYDEEDELQFVKYRKTDFDKTRDRNKEWCQKDCKPILFGMDNCEKDGDGLILILTEGQIDSLSVAEAGLRNVVSVPTGANGFTWVPYCWDFLNSYSGLCVFGDHERGKITLLDEMARRFRGQVYHVRPEDYQGCKDANELLLKHGKEAVRNAVTNAVPIENPRIKKLSDVEHVDISQLQKVSTGIGALDALLGGFYLGQLVVLTGRCGDGKSTLANQFVAYAVRERKPVFYYSGELMDWYVQDWFDRQVAGPNHINKIVAENGHEEYAVDGAVLPQIHEWYEDYCYLYNNSIIEDGEEEEVKLTDTIQEAIAQYGCKIIVIDNLMTAIADDLASDLYRQQTRFVRTLAKIAKRDNVLIILVAHPRKRNVESFENDDVSGSANITNLADIVLQYSRPKDKELEKMPEPCDRLLRVTKNRMFGKTDSIRLWFDEPSKRISRSSSPGSFRWNIGWEKPINLEADSDDGWRDASELEEIPF